MVLFSSDRSPLTVVFCISSPLKGRAARMGEVKAGGPRRSSHFHADWAHCRCPAGGLLGWKVQLFFCKLVLQVEKKTPKPSWGFSLLGARESLAWLCSLQAAGSRVRPFYGVRGQKRTGRLGPGVHTGPYYNIIPRESSCTSLSVPCRHVPRWSCLLAAWGQMEHPQCPGTAWSPAPYSWTAPRLAAETESGTGTILITFQHRRVATPVLSGCSHLDPSGFRVSPTYGFPSSVSIKYQGWQWLINKQEQFEVKHKMQRAA